MSIRHVVFLFSVLFAYPNFASTKIIAIDGINGFVGSSLIKNLDRSNLKIGCHNCANVSTTTEQYFSGNLYNPVYLKQFLKSVDLYYQMAGIASIEPRNSLEEYILTNSIGPYLASRINKSMTIMTLSTVAIYDVEQNEATNNWVAKFMAHYAVMGDNITNLSENYITKNLAGFISINPPPKLQPKQYYCLSKLLLEKLLRNSSLSRNGNIYLIRPALIIGDEIKNRRGISVVKNIMDAIFNKQRKYEVWNRPNCYTPINKLKEMMLYITNSNNSFKKFEIFDAGCVTMNQHDFVNKLLSELRDKSSNITLVNHSGFDRKIVMQNDDRLTKFYPALNDVNQAIKDMIVRYQEQS